MNTSFSPNSFEVSDTRIHYLSSKPVSSDLPIVFLLHGWGHNKELLRALGEAIASAYQVVIVDLPGFGESPAPKSIWGTADYANAISELITHIAEDRRVVLCGHSFGGRVAAWLAAKYPEKVFKLALMASSGLQRKRSFHEQIRIRWIRILSTLARVLETNFKISSFRNWFRERYGSTDYKNAGDMRDILVKTINEDISGLLADIQCPTLLLWGENDVDTPPELAHRFNSMLPNASCIILPHKDHHLHLGSGAGLCGHYILEFISQD